MYILASAPYGDRKEACRVAGLFLYSLPCDKDYSSHFFHLSKEMRNLERAAPLFQYELVCPGNQAGIVPADK